MEIAVSHHQPLFGAPLQHPLLQGAVIYPGKGSAWQPVVTNLPAMTEVPKESIIANTDFTTTSGLAKRRLSSKKRRKQLEANRLSGGSDAALSDSGSARSPSDSAYGSCFSVSSATSTPPGHDRTSDPGQLQLRTTSTASTLSHPSPLTHSSSSSFHPLVHHPQTQSQLPPTSLTTETLVLRNPGNCPTHTTVPTLAENQLSNPAVLSQLQQELNYRFLSNGHPHSSTEQAPSQDAPSQRPAGVKWCNAHISVARMIQQRQLEEAQMQQHVQSQQLGQSVSQPHTSTNTAHALSHNSQTEAAAALSAQQQQQQLALLQMYGVHPTVSTGVQQGYMAVPYSTMHEVPLVHFATLPQVNASNSVAMVKPGEAVLSLPNGCPVQVAATSGPSQVQQFAHAQSVPLTVASAGGLVMQQGGGSWMAPVPIVGGNCVINPLHAGILAAPWVK